MAERGPAGLDLPPLRVPRTAQPRTGLTRWLLHGGAGGDAAAHHATHPWWKVLWLSGVDYFSTLGYQPGIALIAAGALSPLATALLVGVTLLFALPVYMQVAGRSWAGQGSIAMLENLLPGWRGKLFALVLLGFAATDFVITMTLSAADAAQHAVENPLLHPLLGEARMSVTLGLLLLLAVVFLLGFSEAIGVAMAAGIPYVALNVVVIGRGLIEIARHPELWSRWSLDLRGMGDPSALALLALVAFPKLALGLSGFETGVSVMPWIAGADVAGRIRATRKLLAAAAVLMSLLLVGSSVVTTLLVPRAAVEPGGAASGRALSHVAHELLGRGFGSVYDLATIAILWFAGASAMAGLLAIVPRYLPRFGMAPRWIAFRRPLVLTLLAADVIVTLIFRAEVEAQGGAYATGVLVLICSAAVAVALAVGREARERRDRGSFALTAFFWLAVAVFVFTLIDNVIERPDGVIIGGCFILAILAVSGFSRWRRTTELRVERMTFADAEAQALWNRLRGKRVHLVPLRIQTPELRERKRREIRGHYHVRGPFAFVHVRLLDNRSEFLSAVSLHVRRVEEGDFVVEAHGAVAVANTLAYLSEQMNPISIFLNLTRRNLMGQALRYLLWGEGEVGLSVYAVLVKYWEWTPEDDVRPVIFLMSD